MPAIAYASCNTNALYVGFIKPRYTALYLLCHYPLNPDWLLFRWHWPVTLSDCASMYLEIPWRRIQSCERRHVSHSFSVEVQSVYTITWRRDIWHENNFVIPENSIKIYTINTSSLRRLFFIYFVITNIRYIHIISSFEYTRPPCAFSIGSLLYPCEDTVFFQFRFFRTDYYTTTSPIVLLFAFIK